MHSVPQTCLSDSPRNRGLGSVILRIHTKANGPDSAGNVSGNFRGGNVDSSAEC